VSSRTLYLDVDPRRRFEEVAAGVFEPLQRYLRRRALADDAADVFAETLLVIWRRIDDVPDEPIAWCIAVARNTLANHRRSNMRRDRLADRVATQPSPTSGGDPQQQVEDSDPELMAAISTLSDSEAEIVRLWAWDRLEPREIATVLELTPNAVSTALSRVKRKLSTQLESKWNDDRIAPPMDIPQVETPPTAGIGQEGDE